MLTNVHFTKMQALGNDFVVLDSITQPLKIEPYVVRLLADRHFGIGCDQVLVVDPPTTSDLDFNFRIFNPDGNEVFQCGNGARCFGRYVYEHGLTNKKILKIGTLSGQLLINISELSCIEVDMSAPNFSPDTIPIDPTKMASLANMGRYRIQILDSFREVTILSLGNPHCIISVPSTKEAAVQEIGQSLQSHPAFPKGVNVSFMQVLARNHIKCRVYERGVGETLACGSAACAAVVAGILLDELNREVKVDMMGGSLTVKWAQQGTVLLSGPALSVFHGEFCLSGYKF